MNESGIPEAHPRFSEYFDDSIYEVGEIDDVAPFNTDEGSDVLWEWSQKVDKISTGTTLRSMLGDDADALIDELEKTRQPDVDDMIIGTGFTLLRFTGGIAPEGRRWLLGALERQNSRMPSAEYSTMLADLRAFPEGVGQQPSPRDKPVAEPSWITITGTNDRLLDKWFRDIGLAVSRDPAWSQWWGTAEVDSLVLHPSAAGPPDRDYIQFRRRGRRRLEVLASSAAISQQVLPLVHARSRRGRLGPHSPLRIAGVAAFQALILRMLHETGVYLSLPPPPSELPVGQSYQ